LIFIAIGITSFTVDPVRASPGYTKIRAVILDKPSYPVGDTIQLFCSYTLLYDTSTENGSATFTLITPTGKVLTQKFYDQGDPVEKYVYFWVNPDDWDPGEGGQLGTIKINVSVDGPQPTSSTVEFNVKVTMAHLNFTILNMTPKIENDTQISIIDFSLEFFSVNNHSSKAKNTPINLSIHAFQDLNTLTSVVLSTDENGKINFSFTSDTWSENLYVLTASILQQNDYFNDSLTEIIGIENSSLISLNMESENLYTYVDYDSANSRLFVTLNSNDTVKNIEWYTFYNSGVFTESSSGIYHTLINAPTSPGIYPVVFRIIYADNTSKYIIRKINIYPRSITLSPQIKLDESSNSLILKITIIDNVSNTIIQNTYVNLKIDVLENDGWQLLENIRTLKGIVTIKIPIENINWKKIRINLNGEQYTDTSISVDISSPSNFEFPFIILIVPAIIILAVFYIRKIRNKDLIEVY